MSTVVRQHAMLQDLALHLYVPWQTHRVAMQAYLHVGPCVSCYPEYREVMVQHLIRHKLGHWDRALRELSSKALAAIVPQDLAYFSSSVLCQLLDLCADPSTEVRQGVGFMYAACSWRCEASISRLQWPLMCIISPLSLD